MGIVGKAGLQQAGARFSKRDDGFGISHLHRSQSALPDLSGKKILPRARPSLTPTKTKARRYRSAHRITSFMYHW